MSFKLRIPFASVMICDRGLPRWSKTSLFQIVADRWRPVLDNSRAYVSGYKQSKR